MSTPSRMTLIVEVVIDHFDWRWGRTYAATLAERFSAEGDSRAGDTDRVAGGGRVMSKRFAIVTGASSGIGLGAGDHLRAGRV